MLYARVQHASEAADDLANWIECLRSSSRLVRVEGVDGSGKSTLAKALAAAVSGCHVEADDFRTKVEPRVSFVEAVRVQAFQAAIVAALTNGPRVIADSVCLDDLLPEAEFE